MKDTSSSTINRLLKVLIYSPSDAPDLLAHVLGMILHRQRIDEAGAYVASVAELAYRFRNWPTLGEAVNILSHLPSDKYSSVADFYRAHYLRSAERNYGDESERILTDFLDRAPASFRARTVLSLATFHLASGDPETARDLYDEAVHQAQEVGDIDTFDAALKMTGTFRSMQGDPKRALAVYETIYPSLAIRAKFSLPARLGLLDLLNSYAIDLAEVGRLDEARHIARYVAGSKFSHVYTEFTDTLREIEAKRLLDNKLTVQIAGARPTIGEMRSLVLVWLTEHEARRIAASPSDRATLIKMYEAYERRGED